MLFVIILIAMAVFFNYMGFYAYFQHKEGRSNRIFLMLTLLFSGWSITGALYQADDKVVITSIWLFYSYLVWTMGTAMILHFCLTIIHLDRRLPLMIYTPAMMNKPQKKQKKEQ